MKIVLPRSNIKRVLIRGVNWIGDTIITLPAVRGIREAFPEAHLAVLALPHVSSLFERCSFIDELIPYPQGKGLHLINGERILTHHMRRKRFDLAVILPHSFRSALIPFVARIPFRVGYSAYLRASLLTHALDERKELLHCHQVEYFYHIASSLGASSSYELPVLEVGEGENTWAEALLKKRGIGEERLLIGINPGSTYGTAKCWFSERFLELARRLINRTHAAIVLVGGRDNASLIHSIAAHLNGQVIEAVGEDLLNIAALVKKCRLLITNDTGPMHIAAAVGTTVVALFGSTNPLTTSPLGRGHHIVRKAVSCSPCLKRECPEDHRCMSLITVDEVEKVVVETLEHAHANTR